MQLIWTDRALGYLDEIETYIARDNPAAAHAWVERLIELAETLPSAPLRRRVLPYYDRRDLREVFLGSYRLIYRVGEDAVQVLGIIEGHRQLPDDLDRAAEPTS